jgi:2-polyprenyl-3-methyl-5-hydroxy-6-metoxy-1,4-benzoquinol methylase
MYKFRKTCRLCPSSSFELVLDLGKQPPSNSFLTKNQLKYSEKKFPLRLYICKKCYHLQLLDVVDKKHLFSNYHYFTSANKPIIEHFKKYAENVYKKILEKKENPFVVEVGSNDGTLLKQLKKNKVNVLGIEPAKNLAQISRKSKIKTENSFFNQRLAKKIAKKQRADLVIANNVLGHVDDLDEFIVGVKELLKNDGVFVFEVPHALNLIKKLEFDTIYHEHISYFSIIPLSNWLKKYELEIFNVEKQKVHGGTIRIYVSKKNNFKNNNSVENIKNIEKKYGITKISTYRNFSKKIYHLKKILQKKIMILKNNNKIIFGYGASAKGNVLLNFCEIDNNILDFVTDTTKIKQGKFTPGTKIKIINPKNRPNKSSEMIALLLAWNYKTAIIKNEKKFLRNGGKFLIPIPKPRIVNK